MIINIYIIEMTLILNIYNSLKKDTTIIAQSTDYYRGPFFTEIKLVTNI